MRGKEHKPRHRVAAKKFTVKESGTLLDFLIKELSNDSRTTVKSLLSHKQVAINGKYTCHFDAPIVPNDIVTIGPIHSQDSFSHSQINILFEDDYLIVIDKASGLLSVGTAKDKEHTAYRILSDYVKQRHPANRIFILHRLDKETSGVMMFAKAEKVQFALQRNWNEMILERKYLAVVEGCPKESEGRIVSRLSENSAMVVHSTKNGQGEVAITNYKVLKAGKQYSLVELNLETGKKNQIRVHMQELGTPVAGDKKYGAKTNPIKRLALHANKLKFVHPITRKVIDYETPVPKRFSSLAKN